MSMYVLLPGAGGAASYWSRVTPMLVEAGHQVVAVNLPGPSTKAGLPEYVDLVVAAAGGVPSVVLVAQSLGGFTAAMAAERLPVQELVLVNAMIPVQDETPGQWWEATGAVQAREAAAERGGYGEFDVATYFLHDVDTTGLEESPDESDAVFGTRCTFKSWPGAPIRVLVGADDRFFPVDFQLQVAKARVGIDADVQPGGHLIALAQPRLVAEYLLAAS